MREETQGPALKVAFQVVVAKEVNYKFYNYKGGTLRNMNR